jgi:hypothetical protein
VAAELGFRVGAGEGNRTLMTSLEGVTQRGDIGPDLLLGMLASDRGIPPVTVVNGTLMARRSWNTAAEPGHCNKLHRVGATSLPKRPRQLGVRQ